jgi:chromosome segregation ATPase
MSALGDVAEELYGLPPDEFTQVRNERAKELRSQDRALADRIRALAKPSTAAWKVNMLVRHHAQEVEQLLALGESLRQAQADLDGEQLRELTRQRRRLTAAVTAQARGLARELGVRVSESVAGQVEETLRAAMTDEGAARAVRTGQLVAALTSTGIGEVDVSEAVAVPEAVGSSPRRPSAKRARLTAVPEPGGEGRQKSAEEQERARARERAATEARQALADAEARLAGAEEELRRATDGVDDLHARTLQLQGELEEVRSRADDLEHQLETVDDELSTAEEARDRAAEEQEASRSAVDEARSRLSEIEQD